MLKKENLNENKRHLLNSIGVFTLTTIISLCVALIFLFLGFKWSASKESLTDAKEIKYNSLQQRIENYTPVRDESIKILIVGCEKTQEALDFIQLVYYDAVKQKLFLVPIPKNMQANVNGQLKTLSEHYEYESIQGVVKGVGSLFDTSINVYMRISKVGIANMVDTIGGLSMNINQSDIDKFKEYSFALGENLLNGEKVSDIIFTNNDNINNFNHLNLQNKLFYNYFNFILDKKNAFNEEFLQNFGEAVYYNFETNLTSYGISYRSLGVKKFMQKNEEDDKITLINLKEDKEVIKSTIQLSPDEFKEVVKNTYNLTPEDKEYISGILNMN